MRTLLFALLVALTAQTPSRDALPPWITGTLDFHQISTGEGNSALAVFPDGTTLLVDAGGGAAAGARIANYLAHAGVTRLDYVVLTHR